MTTAQQPQDEGASTSQIAGVIGSVAPFNWQEAGRYLHMMADVASSLADRVNSLVRRYPTASGGVLLGATIAGVAVWRRSRSAKSGARSTREGTRSTGASPARSAKRRSTGAASRARGSKTGAAKSESGES